MMFPSPGLVKTDRPDGGPVTVQIGRKREGGRERRERERGRERCKDYLSLYTANEVIQKRMV